ncbi:MAG: biotin--[acetyl-CoA-carboxylase] ligase [Planctomycetia bacterium]|nr:biotin--[acetyl-CoA-carboxylase] ligase [Planctomycetia bacterium]
MSFDLDPSRLRLPTFIAEVDYARTVDSTNDVARRRAGDLHKDVGLLAIAEEQTAGRGRGSNRWWTGAGSLAWSLLIDPARFGIAQRYASMVPLAAATALVEVVTRHLPSPAVGIHWPNDVYLGPRKLAGILVEALGDGRQIVGIGLNVNNSVAAAPPEVAAIVASLADEVGAPLDRTDLLSELLEALGTAFADLGRQREDLATLADELCTQRGSSLTLTIGDERVTGLCTGIAPDGALVLETPTGRRTIYSGIVVR